MIRYSKNSDYQEIKNLTNECFGNIPEAFVSIENR